MISAFRELAAERQWILEDSGHGEPAIETSTDEDDLAYAQRRAFLGNVVVNGMLVGSAMACGLAHLMTLGNARRFCLNVIAPASARLAMRLLSIEVRFHGFENLPSPCIVTANHTSTLDLFVISMLPVKDKRSFMARWTKIYPPLAIISWATGTIFTAPQKYPEERARLFQAAEEVLRKTGDSVYLSPEGKRRTDGVINPFNKGTFHLATNLGWPIVPVFVDIPPRINPGVGFATRPGVINVYARPPIDTSEWTLDELIANKESVRELYVAFPEGWGADA